MGPGDMAGCCACVGASQMQAATRTGQMIATNCVNARSLALAFGSRLNELTMSSKSVDSSTPASVICPLFQGADVRHDCSRRIAEFHYNTIAQAKSLKNDDERW